MEILYSSCFEICLRRITAAERTTIYGLTRTAPGSSWIVKAVGVVKVAGLTNFCAHAIGQPKSSLWVRIKIASMCCEKDDKEYKQPYKSRPLGLH